MTGLVSLPVQMYRELLLSPWHWRGHGYDTFMTKLFYVIGKALSGELSCMWTGHVIPAFDDKEVLLKKMKYLNI